MVGVSTFMLLIFAVFWLLPFIIVLSSSKVDGSEKVAWLLGVIFISWFAWIFFLLLAPIKPRSS